MSDSKSLSAAKHGHENFEIPEAVPTTRKKIIRQDRHEPEGGNCFVEINEVPYDVINYGSFGIALRCPQGQVETFEKQMAFERVHFVFQDTEVQTLHIRVVRAEQLDSGDYRVGFEINGEPLNVDRIDAIKLTNQVIREHIKQSQKMETVPEVFRLKVLQIKNWLEVLQHDVTELEKQIPVGDNGTRTEYEQTAEQLIFTYLRDCFPLVTSNLPKDLADIPPDQVKGSIEFLRDQLNHLIYQAPVAHRAYYKPRGYAGDYEMMNHLYREEYAGQTLFAKCLHHYFVNEPAGQAVRNRATYLQNKILQTLQNTPRDKKVKILSVASGPAMEMQLFIKNYPEFYDRKIEFHCLDQDEESLKHAQRQIRTLAGQCGAPYEFQFLNKAIKNIITRGLDEGDYDLIYSAGLFDYLSDPVAQLTADRLQKGLVKGGRLVIGNFNVGNPSLPIMNLALDWHLIYRSPDDLKNLFGHLDGKMAIEKELLAVNIFCVINSKI